MLLIVIQNSRTPYLSILSRGGFHTLQGKENLVDGPQKSTSNCKLIDVHRLQESAVSWYRDGLSTLHRKTSTCSIMCGQRMRIEKVQTLQKFLIISRLEREESTVRASRSPDGLQIKIIYSKDHETSLLATPSEKR